MAFEQTVVTIEGMKIESNPIQISGNATAKLSVKEWSYIITPIDKRLGDDNYLGEDQF